MTRVTSILLLATGVLLLVTWLVSSASSAPPQGASQRPATTASRQNLDDINEEVDRLQTRVSALPSTSVVERDPFQFVSPAGRSDATAARGRSEASEPEASSAAWPRLVAILSSGTESAPVLQAVFEDASQIIQIRSEGESIDGVVVERIMADSVFITASTSDRSTRLSIR